jgi:hypothetical protein
VIVLSDAAGNAALDAIGRMMDGGGLEILSANGTPLAVLRLSDPAAMPAVGNELELNEIIEEDSAFASGTATAARIVGADGTEILSCDCGDENSDAVIKLSGEIVAGAPVRISSFRLAMP